MIGIYAIQNLKNGKLYIGQSLDIERRWQQEKKGKRINNHLKRSFEKYGIKNFVFYVLEFCKKEQLNERERFYISLYHTLNSNYGYNKTSGGDSSFIRSHQKLSKEHRKKISEANKKYKPTKEVIERAKLTRKANLIKKHKVEIYCLETKEIYSSIEEIIEKLNLEKGQVFKCLRKVCESTKKYHICYASEKDTRIWNLHPYKNNGGTKNWHEDTIEKIRQKALGRVKSQKTRDKISKANKGKKLSEEYKKKISKSQTGIKRKEGTGKNISDAKKTTFRARANSLILCIETNEKFYTITEAATALKIKFPKVNCDGIKRVLKGTQITSGGLHFKRVQI